MPGVVRYHLPLFLSAFVALLPTNRALAHRIPSDNHDRTIVVRLSGDAKARQIVVNVTYTLEVDEDTAILTDLQAVRSKINLGEFHKQPGKFYQAFVDCYGQRLAKNLDAALDGKELLFACTKSKFALRDEQNHVLGHLRCEFDFRATTQVTAAAKHQLTFKEGNYEGDPGQIRLSFTSQAPIRLLSREVPDPAWLDQPLFERDENKLRTIKATFAVPASLEVKVKVQKVRASRVPTTANEKPAPGRKGKAATNPPAEEEQVGDQSTLKGLFLYSKHGLILLLLLAAGIGAVHALAPGHGKTLVAAYLVGEQGTVWHALLLGVVTTLTHTGGVLLAAILLTVFFPTWLVAVGIVGLGLVMGLSVACLGFWLLLRRLSGRADHIHLGAHGHHHHHHLNHDHGHGHADHYHDEHGQVHSLPAPAPSVGWWGLIVLGMSGGIVPCWDAIAMLVLAVGMNALWLAVPLLLAFSAGLAGVLVLIGIVVVNAKGFVASHWGEGRFIRALPVISAALVTLVGLWLCYDCVRPHAAEPIAARKTAPSDPQRAR